VVAEITEIAAQQVQIGADRLRVREQRWRRVGIGADRRSPARKMPAFSKPIASRVGPSQSV
jgi:hypothetical protein